MMKQSALAVLAAHLVGLAAAGTKVWDGSFDDLTVASLADWSWSNQAGPYQWYIHGDSDTSAYLDFSADAAGPGATKGAKVTLDDTAYWNGQNMRRTELIPSVTDTSSITSGTLYYHFSLKREDTNAPSTEREHQIAFFESHFTELKYGGSSADKLQWFAASSSQWETAFEAGVWHNFAYEIDFDASTVGLWHSTGSEALTQAVAPVKASVSSNGADWHVGVLELQGSSADTTEDLFYSGVYIESGDLSTSFSSAGSSSSGSSSGAASSAAAPSSAAAAASSSAPASSAAPVAAASSSSASSSAVVAAPTSSAVPTAAAPATTALASSSTKSCVKRTKTVYVTQSA